MPRTRGARTVAAEVKVAAVRLVRSGMTQAEVARAFRIRPSTVSRWWRLARTGGGNALARRPVTGRPRKISERELRGLTELLRRPPTAYGLGGRKWTLTLISELIQRTHGVDYHPSHVWRVLRSIGARY